MKMTCSSCGGSGIKTETYITGDGQGGAGIPNTTMVQYTTCGGAGSIEVPDGQGPS
jgi:hypothetical protein